MGLGLEGGLVPAEERIWLAWPLPTPLLQFVLCDLLLFSLSIFVFVCVHTHVHIFLHVCGHMRV